MEFCSRLLSLERHLLKFAYRLTLSKPDAKDLVQETFLKALINRDKFVNDENFKAWTLTILRNAFINNYRRNFRQNTIYSQTSESFCFNQTEESGSDNPDSVYSELEIKQNIEQLKDVLRIPFKMHIDGFKYKEIAFELNLNIGTVKSRIFLSRKQLRDQLNR
jgi:RNA polymerase sigma-70 factor (ECF subfamily)